MQTIRSSREIDAMFRSGKKVSHPLMMLLVAPAPPSSADGRVCFVAGRRMGGAVARNRARRVLREAARRANGPWRTFDVALVARVGVVTARPSEIDAALQSVLRRAQVL